MLEEFHFLFDTYKGKYQSTYTTESLPFLSIRKPEHLKSRSTMTSIQGKSWQHVNDMALQLHHYGLASVATMASLLGWLSSLLMTIHVTCSKFLTSSTSGCVN